MNSIQEQELSRSLKNTPAQTIQLAARAVHLATEMHRAAMAYDWIKAEHFASRLENVDYRVKLDSRQHQITLESQS